MDPGACRAIEYDIVASEDASCAGLIAGNLLARLNWSRVAVVRCVDDQGEKLTALTNAEYFWHLLSNGRARDPKGMPLGEREFPVVRPGWQQAGWLAALPPICRRRGCTEEATDDTLVLCASHHARLVA